MCRNMLEEWSVKNEESYAYSMWIIWVNNVCSEWIGMKNWRKKNIVTVYYRMKEMEKWINGNYT